MSTISVSQTQFSFMSLVLKYIASTDSNTLLSDVFVINISDFKSFIQKRVVIAIETKTKILKSFSDLLLSLLQLKIINDAKNDQFSITKNQICSLIQPIISKAALNPSDSFKLNDFFKKFNCNKDNQNFFLELMSP